MHHFVVVSCANGYVGYVTTPEEYSVQHYEGGHALYGPQTQPFLAAHLSKLALDMKNGATVSHLPGKWSYSLRIKNSITGNRLISVERKTISDPEFVASKAGDESYWSFVWKDLPSSLIPWGKTLVRIEESANKQSWRQNLMNRQPLDNSGYDVAVLHQNTINHGEAGIYETRGYNPATHAEDKYYRFVILPQTGQDLLY